MDRRASADPHGFEEAGEGLPDTRRTIEELTAALRESREREAKLRHELQHRIRNLLAVIRSIYRRSLESDAGRELFPEHFKGRLDALARYQSRFDETAAFDLEDILRDELLGTRSLDGPDCSIEGPPVMLDQKTAELIGLAVHELTTNAIKFGALAQQGRLRIEWSIDADDDARMVTLRWIESGVSIAGAAPRPVGFGRQLIEEALPYQLGATTVFELKPGGLVCSIRLPLRLPAQIEGPASRFEQDRSI